MDELVATPAGAMCVKHPDQPASATCARCGDFCCDRCRSPEPGRPLCLSCAARPGVAGPRVVNPLPRLWQLFVMPDRFFARDLRFPMGVTFFVAYVVGIAGSIDRVENRIYRQDLAGLNDGVTQIVETYAWSKLWSMALVSGVLGGLIYYYLGGFWYGLRLRWSGVPDADARGVRELNIYTELVFKLPYLAVIIGSMFVFDSLDQREGSTVQLVFLQGCVLLGILSSFRGVLARYEPNHLAGAFWFLVLPGVRFLLGIALLYWLESGGLVDLVDHLIEAE